MFNGKTVSILFYYRNHKMNQNIEIYESNKIFIFTTYIHVSSKGIKNLMKAQNDLYHKFFVDTLSVNDDLNWLSSLVC